MSVLNRVLSQDAMNGFRTWNMECALAQKRHTMLQSQLKNALSAEDAVGLAFDVSGAGNYFLRKRVYVSEQGRNREIDCIGLCNGRLYVVEVKNWRGDVWSNGARWYQKAMEGSTQSLEFGDIFAEADFKTNALHRHFEYDHKVRVPLEALVTCIVFTNPAVKLDPKSVGSRPFVFTLDGFAQFLLAESQIEVKREAGWSGAMLNASMSLMSGAYNGVCDFASAMTRKGTDGKAKIEMTPAQEKREREKKERKEAHQALKSALSDRSVITAIDTAQKLPSLTKDHCFKIRLICEAIRTWDLIELHNGVVIHGDVIAVDVPSIGCNYLRTHMTNIRMNWAQQGPVGFVKSLWNGTACYVKLELIATKQRGKRKDVKAAAEAASKTDGSADKLTGNKSLQRFKDTEGNIIFPVKYQYSREMSKNDRLVYRSAGKPQAQEVPLAHVRFIEFSKNRSLKGGGAFVEK